MTDELDDQFDEELAHEAGENEGNATERRKHPFLRELKSMMYGFGDDETPNPESVELLENLVIHFIQNMTVKLMDLNKSNKIQVEDLMYLLRKDPRKFARARDLLIMNEELKRARKAFEEVNKY